MDKERRQGAIADIMKTSGREKYRVLALKGVPTFLLLDGGDATPRDAPPHEEGAALAAAAGDIYRNLSAEERAAWPGGVALALHALADRAFFPPTRTPAGAPREEDDTFRALAEGRYVRVVNFHATPPRLAGGLEAQLSRLAESFASVSYDDLIGLVLRGEWPHDRPGVVLHFYDGFRDNYDVAAPILDRLGLTGWFSLVSGWISGRPKDQRAFLDEHFVHAYTDDRDLPADGRFALSPAEVGDLAARGHVIASHTRTHSMAPPDLTPEDLAREVGGSRRELEAMSGTTVGALSWRRGVQLGANPDADAALRDAGYDLVFANHAVQRVR